MKDKYLPLKEIIGDKDIKYRRSHCAYCRGKSINNGSDRSSIQIHHIIPKRYGGKDVKENLVRLCTYCHALIHKVYRDVAIGKFIELEGPDFFIRCYRSLMSKPYKPIWESVNVNI